MGSSASSAPTRTTIATRRRQSFVDSFDEEEPEKSEAQWIARMAVEAVWKLTPFRSALRMSLGALRGVGGHEGGGNAKGWQRGNSCMAVGGTTHW